MRPKHLLLPSAFLLLSFLFFKSSYAGLNGGAVFEFRANATAGMVNGIGYDPSYGGTDYSQQTGPQINGTDLYAFAGSSSVFALSETFTSAMVGNYLHITTTGTVNLGPGCGVSWYEIVSSTDPHTVVLDRTISSATCRGSTFAVGGAGSLNSTFDNAFFNIVPASSTIYFQAGNYITGQAINITITSCTLTNACFVEGYNASRGDNPTFNNQPQIDQGGTNWGTGQYYNFANLRIIGATNNNLNCGTGIKVRNCVLRNYSSTTGRTAIATGAESAFFFCDFVSQNGAAVNSGSNGNKLYGCYIHDSDQGVTATAARNTIVGCVFANNKSGAWNGTSTTGSHLFANNTFYGSEVKLSTGIFTSGDGPDMMIFNNIFYGFFRAVQLNIFDTSNIENYNDFFNNNFNRINASTGPNSIALNPGFINASQISSNTASTSGNVLTQSGGDFSTVVDSYTYVNVISGTGVTIGIYLIQSHTGTTLTVNNPLGTGSNVAYYVNSGNNFAVGANMKAAGFPGMLGLGTTSYLDLGAVQRREPTLSSISVH